MRPRTRQLWAFAASVALFLLISVAGHSRLATGSAGTSTGMSAPAAPKAFVESEPVAKLLRSHFDWSGQIVRSAITSILLPAVSTQRRSGQHADPASQYYGPLYRRPPPSLS